MKGRWFLAIGLAVFLLAGGSATAQYPSRNDDAHNNPLAQLTKSQKAQYEAFLEYDGYLAKGKGFDRVKMCQKMYGAAALWCQTMEPKYREACRKALDRAADSTATRRKQELEQIGKYYGELSEHCQAITQACRQGDIRAVNKAMHEYILHEGQAQARNVKLFKRDWLTEQEMQIIYFSIKRRDRERQANGNENRTRPPRQVQDAAGYQHQSQSEKKRPRR